MSNSALEALQAANASYRKELELIDSLTADGVFDAQEADAQRAQAKTKLDKVRCSGACERA
jgi:multidrug resistance efflux pump